jgi:ABC-type transport system involved in multi-copper enzyme maturation permease subunit
MRLDPSRVTPVAWVAFRRGFRGLSALALLTLALVPSLIVLAIAAFGGGASATGDAAQGLFLTLTVRVVAVLVLLVLFVAQFRSEIELDTLTYLTARSVSRPEVTVGKYLGALGAALVFLLPAGLLPLVVAAAVGAPAPAASVGGAIVVDTLLASLAYGAIFLLFGLLTSSALLVGLLYGFLWEELALILPGSFPQMTILYYLIGYAHVVVGTGPLSGGAAGLSVTDSLLAPLVVAAVFVAITAVVFRWVETAPERISA